MKWRIFIFLFILSLVSQARSGTSLLNDSILHEIRITIAVEDWFEKMETDFQNNLKDPEKFPEIYYVCNAEIDGKFIDSIGMRQKGNYSNIINRSKKKKPFKLAFDEFRDQKFNGLKKINLNNGTDDPTFAKEALVYKLMRDQGVPAPRTSYAKLFINGEYWGLYLIVENVDKTFLKDHYGKNNNEGNLFKTDRGAGVSLKWYGDDKAAYQKEGLLLKTNEDIDDWNGMYHFIDVINNTKDSLKEKVSKVFDVESYLKILAIEKLCYSWDSYWGNGNNFYLYQHPDGKMHWIPWDFNETFQEHHGTLKALLPDDYYLVPTNRFDKRPLLKAVFSVPEWKEKYLETLCSILSDDYTAQNITPVLVRWHYLIEEAYRNDDKALDPIKPFQVGLTEEFEHRIAFYRTGFAFDVTMPGLIPFIESRKQWAHEQFEQYGYSCELNIHNNDKYNLQLFPNPASDRVAIQWKDDHLNASRILLFNSAGAQVYQGEWMFFTGKQLSFNAGKFQPGIYLLLKQDSDGYYGVAKLVIQ